MSGVSLPVTRPTGRALLVSSASSRAPIAQTLDRLGFDCSEVEDPYAAMAQLCRQPAAFRAVILSLAGLYREELAIIRTIKRKYPHAEVWLTHTDGRHAALADAMRLGADGLLDDDGLHRIALAGATAAETSEASQECGPALSLSSMESGTSENRVHSATPDETETASGEPILTADELKALLQEQPSVPPAGPEAHG